MPLVLVSRQGNKRYARLEQLAGKRIALAPGSAAGEAIGQVNERLAQRRLAPIGIDWVDPSLAVEDVLEMVQAGIYPCTVVEQPIAERWAKVFKKIRIDRHLVLDNRQNMTWYVRRDASMLHASVDRFLKDYHAPAEQDGNFQRLYRHAYQVRNPLEKGDRKKLEAVRPTLQRFAEQYRLDWLALAAVAYKESNLTPGARGASGLHPRRLQRRRRARPGPARPGPPPGPEPGSLVLPGGASGGPGSGHGRGELRQQRQQVLSCLSAGA